MLQRELSTETAAEIIKLLKLRFEKNINRHKNLDWSNIQTKLELNTKKLWSLYEMEITGGEPDVVGIDNKTQQYIFMDTSAESPIGRRSLCYDHEALNSRKTAKPKDSAVNMVASMGIAILTEEEYKQLQKLGEFDTKTSSWVKTPVEIRKLGGAIYCDRRYNHVFTYHNGAESYYSARGFRGMLKV